jgi:hypothetical protein
MEKLAEGVECQKYDRKTRATIGDVHSTETTQKWNWTLTDGFSQMTAPTLAIWGCVERSNLPDSTVSGDPPPFSETLRWSSEAAM